MGGIPPGRVVTPEEMDAVFDRKLRADAEHDIATCVALFTDDAVHEFVGQPYAVVRGADSIRYRFELLYKQLVDEVYTPVRRAYGENFLYNEHLLTASFPGSVMGVAGESRTATFRVLLICEFRDGLISHETVWMDAGELMIQLLAPKTP
jgi:hypothetical protein